MKGMELVAVDAREGVLMVMNEAKFHSLVHVAPEWLHSTKVDILDGPGLFVGPWDICQYPTEGPWKELL